MPDRKLPFSVVVIRFIKNEAGVMDSDFIVWLIAVTVL